MQEIKKALDKAWDRIDVDEVPRCWADESITMGDIAEHEHRRDIINALREQLTSSEGIILFLLSLYGQHYALKIPNEAMAKLRTLIFYRKEEGDRRGDFP